jgi:hypothetical protein
MRRNESTSADYIPTQMTAAMGDTAGTQASLPLAEDDSTTARHAAGLIQALADIIESVYVSSVPMPSPSPRKKKRTKRAGESPPAAARDEARIADHNGPNDLP